MNEDDHLVFTETSSSDEEENGPKPMSIDSERGVGDDEDEDSSSSSSSDDERRFVILERKRRRPSSPPPPTRAKATVTIRTVDANGEENSGAFDVKHIMQDEKKFVLIVEQESESEDGEEEEEEEKAVNVIEAPQQQQQTPVPDPAPVVVAEVAHVPEIDLDGDPSATAPTVCVSTYLCRHSHCDTRLTFHRSTPHRIQQQRQRRRPDGPAPDWQPRD